MIYRLVEHFLSKYSRLIGREIKGMSPEAMQKMIHFQWKGNVRELENVIERAATLGRGPVMEEHIIDECLQRGYHIKCLCQQIPAGVLIWRNPYGDREEFHSQGA